VNAGSELILRQLVAHFGRKTHLVMPTFALFEEIAGEKTHTSLHEEQGFRFNMKELKIPQDTTLAIIVNPNNPNGSVLDIRDNLALLEEHPNTMFLVDEAFIEFGGRPVAELVPYYPNLMVTRTFSKAFSLAGLRVGYVVAPEGITDWLNTSNDAYPLARPSQAAAIACLENMDAIRERVSLLKGWAQDLRSSLEELGVQTFPTETYFFLGKVPHMTGDAFAEELRRKDILVKALHQPGIGDNYVRFTTSTPENNALALEAIKEVLTTEAAQKD
jgi:histidinol-phosphate aminotransferase